MAEEKTSKDRHVLIASDVHRRLKSVAALQGVTVRDYLTQCVTRCLDEVDRPAPDAPRSGQGRQVERA